MASDRIFGLLMAFVALAYIAGATQIQTNVFSGDTLPKLMPIGLGIVATICALTIAARPDPEPAWPALRSLSAIGVATVVMIGYAYALKPLGFLIPTAFAAGVLSYQINPRPLGAFLIGIGLSFGLFALFKYALGLGLFAVPKAWIG